MRRWTIAVLAAALPATAQQVTVTPRPDGTAVVNTGTVGARITELTLAVTVGLEATPVRLPAGPDSPVKAEWVARVDPEGVRLPVTITNQGQATEPALVELALTATVVGDGPLAIWNGLERIDSVAPRELTGIRGIFPLACAWTAAQAVGLGWSPDEWHSWLRHAWQPAPGGGSLSVGSRTVLDRGQSETMTFVLLTTSGREAPRQPVARFQRMFEKWFRPATGIDQRTNLNGATYNAWTGRPAPENCRRTRSGWEWCYAPFRRTGDTYVREELWDYQPARPISAPRNLPAAEYRAWRARQLANGGPCDVGMMCYLASGVWCEVTLARERYPNAIITDPTVKTLFDTPWVTGHDNEYRVFPGAPGYAEVVRDDLRQLAAENPISGFAFDTAEGGARWQHPDARRHPRGRAWDKDGIYVDEAVGIAELMDYVHTLRRDGLTMAVVSNPTGRPSYLTAFRSDAVMYEGTPWETMGGSAADHLRLFCGQKGLVYWEDWLLENQVDWQAMTPAQIVEAYGGLADYAILEGLRIGCLPTPRMALGVPKVVAWLPVMADLMSRGWQPESGLTGLPQLDRARYGEAALAIGNRTGQTVRGELSLQGGELEAARAYLLSPYRAGALRQEVAGGATRFAVELPSREAAVFEPRAALSPDFQGSAEVSYEPALPRPRLRLALTTASAATLTPLVPDDLEIETLRLDDRQVTAPGPLALSPGRHELEVVYRSLTFDETAPELQKLSLNGPVTIACNDPALADTEAMLRDFLARATKATVVADAPTALALRLEPALDGARRVTATATSLSVRGRTAAEVREGLRRVLAQLERRYPYAGGFGREEPAVRAGLVGKTLTPLDSMYRLAP